MNKELERQILAKNIMNQGPVKHYVPPAPPKNTKFDNLDFVDLIYCNPAVENKNYLKEQFKGLNLVIDSTRGLVCVEGIKKSFLNIVSNEVISIEFTWVESEEKDKPRIRGISIIVKS